MERVEKSNVGEKRKTFCKLVQKKNPKEPKTPKGSGTLTERTDIDDGENKLKTPQKEDAENLDNSVINDESGATSPVKKSPKKSRKRQRNPE